MDVAKAELVIAGYPPGTLREETVRNDGRSVSSWLRSVPPGSRIAVESTAGYRQPLVRLRLEAGMQVCVLHPKDARRWAQGSGARGKTDRIDARMIADFIAKRHDTLHPYRVPSPARQPIDALIRRRGKVIEQRKALVQTLGTMPTLSEALQSVLRSVDALVAQIDDQISQQVRADAGMKRSDERLTQIPGFGPLMSATLASLSARMQSTSSDSVVAFSGLDPRPDTRRRFATGVAVPPSGAVGLRSGSLGGAGLTHGSRRRDPVRSDRSGRACRWEVPVSAFDSIRSRILAFAALATLVPSVGLGLLAAWRFQATVEENAAVELRTLARFARSEVSSWVAQRVDDVRAVSGARTMLDGLSASASARPSRARDVEAYLRSVRRRLDSMLELAAFDAQGRPIARSGDSGERAVLPVGWSPGVAGGAALQRPPRWNPVLATTTMTVVVPVLTPANEAVGAMTAVLDLARLRARLERIANATSAELVLLAPDGRPALGSRGPAGELVPLGAPALRALLSQPGERADYPGHRGREVIGVAAASAEPAIAVVAERDRDALLRERRRLLGLFAGVTGALTLLVGALAWRLGRSIVGPLDGLVAAVDGVAAGRLDVRVRATARDEVGRLARAFDAMVERLRRSRAEVEEAQEALRRQNRLLEELSVTDGLTGAGNRKKLDSVLAERLALFRRHRRPFALVMLDLDHFKALNDTHGHLAGDRVLAEVAGILKASVRGVDHVGRYGGEEFAIVLVEATLEGALDTAERIREAVEKARIDLDGRTLQVTASLGVTRSRPGDRRPEDLFSRADAALYEAKRAGRNRVRCADPGALQRGSSSAE